MLTCLCFVNAVMVLLEINVIFEISEVVMTFLQLGNTKLLYVVRFVNAVTVLSDIIELFEICKVHSDDLSTTGHYKAPQSAHAIHDRPLHIYV